MGSVFHDRRDAGRRLADALAAIDLGDAVVVAAEVARRLGLPLDALAVRKIGYPRQPEYGIGAVTPGEGGVHVRTREDLDDDELERAVEAARSRAEALDAVLHEARPPADRQGRTVVLVDDGLATGATMVAAARWARAGGAARVVIAVPVAAAQSATLLRGEADDLVCLHVERHFGAVGLWYDVFTQTGDDDVVALLDELGETSAA